MSNINAVPDPNLGILRQYSDGTANLTFQTNSANAVVIDQNQNANFVSTGAVTIPRGTIAQRPSPGVNGMFRANSNFGSFEVYLNGSWDNVSAVTTPINSVAPVVSGSTTVGGNATVTTGTWNNSPTSYAYQWLANSTAIANATANVFTITSTQTGANLSCNVTAINASGSNIPTTSNSVGPVTATYTATYLVIAGGGGGGGGGGGAGGGGAGGYLSNTATFSPGVVYTATVGSGGGAGSEFNNATNGNDSSLSGTGLTTVTSTGGGKGGVYYLAKSGGNGGSGGGGAETGAAGTGTAGQGNNGGQGDTNNNGGGGGGAGGAGGFRTPGSGLASSITGSSVTRAAGGGGSVSNGGGSGSATANTGNGGPAGGSGSSGTGGASGVVIISVPTSSYSGVTTGSPTVTTSGSNTIITFNSSGTYTA